MTLTNPQAQVEHKVGRLIEQSIDDIAELTRELTRLSGALMEMQERGLGAPQVSTPISSDVAMDINVRRVADLTARVALINELRVVQASMQTAAS